MATKDIGDGHKELVISSSEIMSTGESFESEIGRGAYSRVFTVEYGGLICAAKEIHSFIVERVGLQQIRETFFQECHHCSILSHPNIVHFAGISSSAIPLMIMELMDESLYDYINNLPQDNCIRWNEQRPILRDVAKGLVYLHEQRPAVVHGDLSPRNILLKISEDEVPVPKIGDLGVARIIKADSKATRSILTQVPGSVDFMPPESCGDRPVYTTATDIFSYGCIILFVASGKWPTPSAQEEFDPVTKKPISYSEIERRKQYLYEIFWLAGSFMNMVVSCLSNDPSKRPTMAAVLEMMMLKLIFFKNLDGKTQLILIKEGSSTCNLLSHISNTLALAVSDFWVMYGGKQVSNSSERTLEDYRIEDFSTLHIVRRVRGGGDPKQLYSYFDDCEMKYQCPFHELFNWDDIYEFSQKQENAYNLLCRKFNLPNEIIRAVEDNNEAKDIRLADVLHRIYHKDPSITWQRITEVLSSSNAYCICM